MMRMPRPQLQRHLWWSCVVAALSNGGCFGGECTGGTSQCNGDVLERCEESSGGVYLTEQSCKPGACVTAGDSGPFCALDKQPDERCASSSQTLCDGDTLISCHAGYATAAYDCTIGESPGDTVVLAAGTSGACVETFPGSQCVAEAEPNPDCPSDRDYFSGCSGNDQVDCRRGYTVKRTPCGSAFCRRDLTAVCSLTEEPDPACSYTQRSSSFCAENTLVHCGWGYPVSQEVCSSAEVCAPFSFDQAVCGPPE